MQYPLINEVEAYWEGLRNGRSLPARADVDPRGLERALPYAFVAERIAPGIARFRVAGQHLHDLMGMDVRGMPLSSLFVPAARERLSELVEEVFESPRVTRVSLNSGRGMGRPALEAALLLLPLLNDKGEVSRALGCLISEGHIGRLPRRFSIAALQTRDLTTGDTVTEPMHHASGANAPSGFAEAATTFAPAKRPDGERPALRLVQTDS
ncbi:PAS domain-containing protein [Actibacterium mucosum]|nr:PAS domain-containing protein [Actibacterium mucosum]